MKDFQDYLASDSPQTYYVDLHDTIVFFDAMMHYRSELSRKGLQGTSDWKAVVRFIEFSRMLHHFYLRPGSPWDDKIL